MGQFDAIVCRMDPNEIAAIRGNAVIDQLNAEIGASRITMKALAGEIGVDYSALRNYLAGKRNLNVGILFSMLAALDIPPDVFIARAMDRAGD